MFLVVLCGICGGQIYTVTSFTSINLVLPCQYHSTNAQYSFTHPSPELFSLSGRKVIKQQKHAFDVPVDHFVVLDQKTQERPFESPQYSL